MKEFLENLYASLDSLTVKGRDNLDILLGCMMAIERQIAILDAPPKEETEVEDGR